MSEAPRPGVCSAHFFFCLFSSPSNQVEALTKQQFQQATSHFLDCRLQNTNLGVFFCLLQSSVFSNQYFRRVCVWLAVLQSHGNAFQRAANPERRRPMRQQKWAHLCFYTPPLALRLSLSQRSAAFVWMWLVLTVQAGSSFCSDCYLQPQPGVVFAGRVQSGSASGEIYGGTHQRKEAAEDLRFTSL